jgi:hypothetical protein
VTADIITDRAGRLGRFWFNWDRLARETNWGFGRAIAMAKSATAPPYTARPAAAGRTADGAAGEPEK